MNKLIIFILMLLPTLVWAHHGPPHSGTSDFEIIGLGALVLVSIILVSLFIQRRTRDRIIKMLLLGGLFYISNSLEANTTPLDPTVSNLIETDEDFERLFEPANSFDRILTRCNYESCEEDKYQYRCKAWLYVVGYKCNFKYEDYAYKYCEEVAKYWGYDRYDDWMDYCKVYEKKYVRTEPEHKKYCAHYYAYYFELLGKGKSDVYNQFKDMTYNRVYDGHHHAQLSIKFDKACVAY